mmetsp:Transcript_20240/g.50930  ORF Transcript_20240/g.50930 Transcript_20240/m.50930 type:complete len:258 (+) Transcript_20240:47-820(+)
MSSSISAASSGFLPSSSSSVTVPFWMRSISELMAARRSCSFLSSTASASASLATASTSATMSFSACTTASSSGLGLSTDGSAFSSGAASVLSSASLKLSTIAASPSSFLYLSQSISRNSGTMAACCLRKESLILARSAYASFSLSCGSSRSAINASFTQSIRSPTDRPAASASGTGIFSSAKTFFISARAASPSLDSNSATAGHVAAKVRVCRAAPTGRAAPDARASTVRSILVPLGLRWRGTQPGLWLRQTVVGAG